MNHYYKHCIYCGVVLNKAGMCPGCKTSWSRQGGVLHGPITAGQGAQINYHLSVLCGILTQTLRAVQRLGAKLGTAASATVDQDSSTPDTDQPSEHSDDRTTKAHSPQSGDKDT